MGLSRVLRNLSVIRNFKKDKELRLDQESISKHMKVFEDFEDLDSMDLSSFELNEEDIDLLTLYFNQGTLNDENLHDLNEKFLLHSFELALRLGIPRLETLLGKEITSRLIDEKWEDGSLIIARKGIEDPLKPIIDKVTKDSHT